ncbi:kelch motif-containing protein [Reichenbachiella ulvae]|uniref:Kelch motif-containing protein n=1 Tax=Reichenbachiella ulvae TaxID=2980104 RepID=A0ABT3CNR4_9BACT|nr:kelch motif-containing protein [Reichenbachiella ulvae]MCV9385259.1 kelch motif-containing protein [Reichenbachiella ulvae]
MKEKLLINLLIIITIILSVPQESNAQILENGLKFNSYETSKDLRTGINFTPEESIEIGNELKIKFDFSYWRVLEAYGHIFRVIGSNNTNIDLVSSPINSSFDDINLILGDSATAVSFLFEEIKMAPNQWMECELVISNRDKYVSFSVNGLSKRQNISQEIEQIKIAFGKNHIGKYASSDVPPMKLKNVVFVRDGEVIRNWPLLKYNENNSYDEIDENKAIATNPNWLIDQHSKWKNKDNIITSTRPQIVYLGDSKFVLITNRQMIEYDANELNHTTLNLKAATNLPKPQASVYLPEQNEIWTYDLDKLLINKFDLASKTYYETPANFGAEPSHWHTSLLTIDNSRVFIGGYGHYQYKNDLILHKDQQWNTKTIKNIEPRYLHAAGQDNNGQLYLFGGYGSKNGKQEVGARVFHQLYQINPENFDSKLLWEIDTDESTYVFSNSMIFDQSDSVFYVLKYEKDKFACSALLESYNVKTKDRQTYGDSLNFNFLDISSFVDLKLDKTNQQLIAVISSKENDQYITQFHTIKFPPKLSSEVIQAVPQNYNMHYAISAGLISTLLLIVFVFKNKKRPVTLKEEPKTIQSNQPDASSDPKLKTEILELVSNDKKFNDEKSAILLLGGFQIIDREGIDISEKFSPTLRSLLTLLLMHSTNQGKGISSNYIWETFWGDKSQSSARNNRNVNIKKLRGLLDTVGDSEIKNVSDKWIIHLGSNIFFDYQYLYDLMNQDEKITISDLQLIKKGNLLPAMEFDWIDGFKAKFSNKIVDYLLDKSKTLPVDDKVQIEIADVIFQHDIINQDALSIKITCLNAMKKFAFAKQTYEVFSKEYLTLYGEEFDTPFEDFIHSTING